MQRFEYANSRLPIAMTDKNNNRYYLHYDQVGSLRAVTNTNGNIVKEITYDSYGNILNDTNPDFKVPFGFAGGLYDEDTKLVHFGYREYDPETGRWLSKDPLLFGGGDSNLYGYVLQDPVIGIDPTGLVDLNLFNPNMPEGDPLYAWAKWYGWIFKGYSVGAHGTPLLDQRNGGADKNIYPEELVVVMKNNGYKGGPVTLAACNAGKPYLNKVDHKMHIYAQDLADLLGVTVYAPTSYITYWGYTGFYTTADGKGLKEFHPKR